MTGISVYILLLSSLSFSVTIGKHNYFEDFFSKYHHYHKSSSTTPSVSSTSEISSSEEISASIPDETKSEDIFPSEDDDETNFVASTMQSDYGEINFTSSNTDRDDDEINFTSSYTDTGRLLTILYIVLASISCVGLGIGFIICCCSSCRKTVRIGYIVETSAPQQSEITTAPQQPPFIQHCPPECTQQPLQQFPSQNQQQLLPQTQYAPMLQPGYQYFPVQQQPEFSPVQPQTHYSPVQQQPQYLPLQPQMHYSPTQPGYQNSSTLEFFNPPKTPPSYELQNPT